MQKIKLFMESNKGKNLATVIIVILVGLGSFGLGRLSKDNSNAGVKIEYPASSAQEQVNTTSSTEPVDLVDKLAQNSAKNSSNTANAVPSQNPLGKAFFASKLGHKYYSIGCSGGKTLKAENKIYFSTEAEAQSAGYEKSSTCK